MAQAKQVFFFDQDGTTVPTITALMERETSVMWHLLFSRRVLSRLSPEMKRQAKVAPLDYFIAQYELLKSDFENAAQRIGVEKWKKERVLIETDFVRSHWKQANTVVNAYLKKHYPSLDKTPFPGMTEVARILKEQGAALVLLTDAVPDHAAETALGSGLVDGIFDLVISRDHISNPRTADGLEIVPLEDSSLCKTPHYVVKNVDHYPKKHPELHLLATTLLGITPHQAVLTDDHVGILNIARKAGVATSLAYLQAPSENVVDRIQGPARWSDYYCAYHEFYQAMRLDPAKASGGHILLRAAMDILDHFEGAQAPDLTHVRDRRGVRFTCNRAEIFTP